MVIGDVLGDGRYEIVHKLGVGGYSTTWLARERVAQRYVALKVPVVDQGSKSSESDILRLLLEPALAHKGQRFIPSLLDEFTFDGPNGYHVCLVQEVAVCSVARFKVDSSNFMFLAETARSIAAQLMPGLSYLHSRTVCHGGGGVCRLS
jgi:serine/threonine protein kinase